MKHSSSQRGSLLAPGIHAALQDSYIKMGRMNAFWRSYPQPAQYVRA